MLIDDIALTQNSDCYCWPIDRAKIVSKINALRAADNMAEMLKARRITLLALLSFSHPLFAALL